MTSPLALDIERARALLREALANEPHRLDLAALAIAMLETPEVDLESELTQLDALAARVRALGPGSTLLGQAQSLRRVLAEEEGFCGRDDRYYDLKSNHLPSVLETKVGMPIALSVIYLEVARRAAIPLFGVSFPGHFIVAGEMEPGRKLVLDPFNAGELLTEDGCETLLKRVAPQLRFTPKMLAPTPVRSIAYRMLNNLKRIHLQTGDGDRALRVVDLMLELSPDHPGDLRARAAILSALGAYRAALNDVERCLELSPDAPDQHSLRLTAKALRERMDFLN